MMVDLQVAEIPWTTSAGGLGTEGYRTGFNVSNMIKSSFTALRSSQAAEATHMEETGELPRLNLPTWPLCTQGARNVSWLHGSILPLRP